MTGISFSSAVVKTGYSFFNDDFLMISSERTTMVLVCLIFETPFK